MFSNSVKIAASPDKNWNYGKVMLISCEGVLQIQSKTSHLKEMEDLLSPGRELLDTKGRLEESILIIEISHHKENVGGLGWNVQRFHLSPLITEKNQSL